MPFSQDFDGILSIVFYLSVTVEKPNSTRIFGDLSFVPGDLKFHRRSFFFFPLCVESHVFNFWEKIILKFLIISSSPFSLFSIYKLILVSY